MVFLLFYVNAKVGEKSHPVIEKLIESFCAVKYAGEQNAKPMTNAVKQKGFPVSL